MDVFHPIADALFGKPCLAIHVQPHLTPRAQAELHRVQETIAGLWPSALHQPPTHALHVTIYPLVPTAEGFDKHTFWAAIEPGARELVQSLGAEIRPFRLRFHRLKAMPVGIIAVAEDESGAIDRIRRTIVETLPPPPGHQHRHYDLIHTTLARFADAKPAPASAVRRIEAASVALDVPVQRIKLFRETLFPCLEGEELASASLA